MSAVVLSLVFVGIQLYLDRQVAVAEQYSFRSVSMKNDIRAYMESELVLQSRIAQWERGVMPGWWNDAIEKYVKDNELSVEEVWAEYSRFELLYFQTDNMYFQYQQGLLDETFWLSLRNNNLRNALRQPFGRVVYTGRSIQRPIDQVILEVEAELNAESE